MKAVVDCSSLVDVELSVSYQPTTVTTESSTSDSVTEDERRLTEGPAETPSTQTDTGGDPSSSLTELEDSSEALDSCCVEGSTTEMREDDAPDSVAVEWDESSGVQHNEVTLTDDVQHHSQQSSCNELSLSLTDWLDISEQGMINTNSARSVSDADVATVSMVLTTERPSTLCHCNSDAPSAALERDWTESSSSETEVEDVVSSRCPCDDGGPDEMPAELDDIRLPTSTDVSDVITPDTSEATDVVSMSSLDVDNLDTAESSTSASDVCLVSTSVDDGMTDDSQPLSDACDVSLSAEQDSEPGGKAYKLDQPLVTDCVSDDSDLESCDTGALHMSVGFQSTPHNNDSSAVSQDASIGVLMVCDDDGLASAPITAVESTSNDDCVLCSLSEADADTPPTSCDSAAAAGEMCTSESDSVRHLTSSDAVTVSEVLLYEVKPRSHEMNQLIANVSQRFSASHSDIVSASHDTALSDNSIVSHDDCESVTFHLTSCLQPRNDDISKTAKNIFSSALNLSV